MAVKLWIDRAKPNNGSRIFHVECSKGGTVPGVPIPVPPIIEGLKYAQLTVVTDDPNVVKVWALKADGSIDQGLNPALAGVLAVVNSSPAGGGKAGRFMLMFFGGDGQATVWVAMRHRHTTPQGTAGQFTGRTDREEYHVTVYNSASQPVGSAEILDAAIVEGEPS